jgi:PAS domain S-box-containing protein
MFANPAAESIFGVPAGGLVGRCLFEFVDEKQSFFIQRQTTRRKRGEKSNYELAIVRPNGEQRNLLVTATPRFDSAGKFCGAFGIFRDITKRVRAEEKLRQASVLNALNHRVSASLSLDQVVETALEEIMGYIASDAAMFYLCQDKELLLQGTRSTDPALGRAMDGLEQIGACLCGAAADKATPVYSQDIQADPLCTVIECKDAGVCSFAALPLLSGDKVLGVLGVASTTEVDYGARGAFLEALAGEIAMGLRNALLYQDGQRHAAELERQMLERARAEEAVRKQSYELSLLNRATQAFSSTLDTDQVLANVLEEVRRLLGVVACSIWLIDPETRDLIGRQATGFRSELVQGWRLAWGEGIAGWVARSGEALIVPDAQVDQRHFRDIDQRTGMELRSILSVPLRVKEKVIGVLQVLDEKVGRFDATDLTLLELLAASAATAIDNARLYEALRRERDLVTRVMETSPVSITVVDHQGQVTFANAEAERVLGLIKDEGKAGTYAAPDWNVVDYEGVPYSDQELPFQRVMSTGQPVYDARQAIEWPDGQRILLSVNAAPLFDQLGQVEGVVSTAEDVTEQVRAREELGRARRQWEEIFQAIGHPALILDAEHNVVAANRATMSVTGSLESELLGQKCYQIFHGLCGPAHKCPMQNPIASRRPETAEMEMAAHDRVFLVSCTPVVDSGGRLQRSIHIATDITDRKRAEEGLRRQNEELAILNAIATTISQGLDLEHILSAILEKVLDIVRMDAGWVQLMDEDLDKHSLLLATCRGVSQEMAQELKTIDPSQGWIGNIVRSSQPFVVTEASGDLQIDLQSLKQVVPYTLAGIPIQARDTVLGVLSVLSYDPREMTDWEVQLLAAIGHQIGMAVENMRLLREASETQLLRELDRLRSELIANASHELRTPLGLIRIFATALLMDQVDFDSETQEKFLRGIEEETKNLEAIVDNLLDLGRMESGRLRLDKRPTDLSKLTKKSLETMQAQLAQHHFVYDFSSEPLVALVDAERIEQVLRNLLSNAIKYSPDGGAITVQGYLDGGQVCVRVSDEGIGIPEEEQERIFERFYRVDNQVTRRARGAGLGLSVCKWILDAHGGDIRVHSVSDAGSTFCVILPVGDVG